MSSSPRMQRAPVAALGALVLCSVAAGCATQGPPRPYSQPQLLRNFALSRCLSLASPGRAGDDAARAAEEYRALGESDRAVYERLDDLAQDYLERGYGGSRREDLDTVKCIDLYNSPELRAIAEDGAPRRDRDRDGNRDRDRRRDRERSGSSRY